uniref:Uncharacterized protein n=1 Tax=Terrapene triunguis TaxID=2587831 RepID=A0A674ICB7_9SAUR
MLEKCQQQRHFEVFIEQSRWPNPRVLSFMMSSKTLNESIEFDVLPAYNALSSGAKPPSQVYEELIQSCSRGGRVLHLLHRAAAGFRGGSPHQSEKPDPPGEILVQAARPSIQRVPGKGGIPAPPVRAGAPVCLRMGAGQQGSSFRHGRGLPDGAGADPAVQAALCLLDHQLQLCGRGPGRVPAPPAPESQAHHPGPGRSDGDRGGGEPLGPAGTGG